jgi:hypothetical protein
MATGLFEIQADHLTELRRERRVAPDARQIVYRLANLPNFALAKQGTKTRCPQESDYVREKALGSPMLWLIAPPP